MSAQHDVNGAAASPEEAAGAVETGLPDRDAGIDDNGNRNGPHDVSRIEGIEEDALQSLAAHLNDPDGQAQLAVEAGRRLHSVWEKYLFGDGGALDELLEAQGIIRGGAVAIPSQRRIAELGETVALTDNGMRQELARGLAGREKADRLRRQRAQLATEHEAAEQLVAARREQHERDQQEVDAALVRAGEEEKAAREAGEERPKPGPVLRRAFGSVWEVVPLPPKVAAVVLPSELAATTIMLEGPLASLLETQNPFAALGIAAAVSASFIGLGVMSGFAAAATRLGHRVAGWVFVLLSLLLLADLGGAMHVLRMGNKEGLEVLTIATFAAVFVSAVTSFAFTARRFHLASVPLEFEPDVPQELVRLGVSLPLPHRAMASVRKAERSRKALEEAQERETALACELAGLDGEIERVSAFADESPLRALEIERGGIAAQAQIDGIHGVLRTQIAQEEAHVNRLKAAARLAWRLVRKEEPLEQEAVAAAVSGAGALLGAILPSVIALLAGAAIAALLWIAGARRAAGSWAAPSPVDPWPPIQPTAGVDSPMWRWLPDRTSSKYEDGGAPDPTIRP